jgi:general nucleoside transport system permease protein
MTIGRLRLGAVMWGIAPLVVALALTSLILLVMDASPRATFATLYDGAFGTAVKRADVAVVWVSLVLCAAGLLFTFTAGQWNIGIEGQVMVGAIFATGAARVLWEQPGALALPLIMLWATLGGALWAMLVGGLKIYGRVHEIFGGLGLNFVATALSIWLIFGPWRQPTGGTLSGTQMMPQSLWMPTLPGLRVSPVAVLVALIVLVLVYLALRGTVWGLKLKAVGRSLRGAYLLGVPTGRQLLSAYVLCGMCAGLAGAFLVLVVHHRLVPSISSGYGFLGILIVLLTGIRALWVVPVALFFAAVSIGSTALQFDLRLDSSLGGVLQAAVVLTFILFQGVREKYLSRRVPAGPSTSVAETHGGLTPQA